MQLTHSTHHNAKHAASALPESLAGSLESSAPAPPAIQAHLFTAHPLSPPSPSRKRVVSVLRTPGASQPGLEQRLRLPRNKRGFPGGLAWLPPEADSETVISAHAVHPGVDARKHQQRHREARQLLCYQAGTPGALGAVPTGIRSPLKAAPWRREGAGVFIPQLPPAIGRGLLLEALTPLPGLGERAAAFTAKCLQRAAVTI